MVRQTLEHCPRCHRCRRGNSRATNNFFLYQKEKQNGPEHKSSSKPCPPIRCIIDRLIEKRLAKSATFFKAEAMSDVHGDVDVSCAMRRARDDHMRRTRETIACGPRETIACSARETMACGAQDDRMCGVQCSDMWCALTRPHATS